MGILGPPQPRKRSDAQGLALFDQATGGKTTLMVRNGDKRFRELTIAHGFSRSLEQSQLGAKVAHIGRVAGDNPRLGPPIVLGRQAGRRFR
jgi:hypothetical protein